MLRVAESTAVPLLAAATTLVAVGCSYPTKPGEPLGQLPETVTSAVPLWIPFRIAAGRAEAPDPRETRLQELRRLTFDGKSRHPVWHPDGRHLLYETGDGGCGAIIELDLSTGARERLSPEGGSASLGGYLEEPRRLAFGRADAEGRCRPRFDQASGWAAPDTSLWIEGPHAEPARPWLPGPAFEIATNRFAGVVFSSTRDGDPELYLLPPGSDPQRLTESPGYDGGASLAPDGGTVAWHAESGRRRRGPRSSHPFAELHVHVATIHGKRARIAVEAGHFDVQPSFMPDSRRLLFSSDYDAAGPGESFDLYLADPESAGPPQRLTHHPASDGEPQISPNGRYLAFTSTRGGGPGLDVYVARFVEAQDQ